MTMELVVDARAIIGESPTWVPREDAIYWIDVKAPALLRTSLDGGADRRWALPADIGAFCLMPSGTEALVALRTGLFRLLLADGGLDLLAPPPYDPARHRFNEGACDASGRFWVGTMFDPLDQGAAPEPATLSSYTPAGGLRIQPDMAELHNGMAWSADGRTFFLSHSQRGTIHAIGFDVADGTLGAERLLAAVPQGLGLPDGAAMDDEGCYWCAIHGGWRLHRYRMDGTLDRVVDLPVSQPTMCAFAGAGLEWLYLTSAREKLDAAQLAREPHAGGVFRFRPGPRGIPRRPYLREA